MYNNKQDFARVERGWGGEVNSATHMGGTFGKPGSQAVASLLPSLKDEEIARKRFFFEFDEGREITFQAYAKYVNEKRHDMLNALFTLGEREGMFQPKDRDPFMLAKAEAHERMVKEKDNLRVFCHSLVDDCVKHFCFQSKSQFQEGLTKNAKNQGIDLSDRMSRLTDLSGLESKLGLVPVANNHDNATAEEFDELYSNRWNAAKKLREAAEELKRAFPDNYKFYLRGLRYRTGPQLCEITGEDVVNRLNGMLDDEESDEEHL